jgi:hypothetical protein
VVVHNLDLVGVSVPPLKADAVLVIDANAVLAFPITSEPLQAVAGRQSEVAKRSGRINDLQFLQSGPPHTGWDAPTPLFFPNPLRFRIAESFDHTVE